MPIIFLSRSDCTLCDLGGAQQFATLSIFARTPKRSRAVTLYLQRCVVQVADPEHYALHRQALPETLHPNRGKGRHQLNFPSSLWNINRLFLILNESFTNWNIGSGSCLQIIVSGALLTPFLAEILLFYVFYREDGVSLFLRNVDKHLTIYTESHPRRQHPSRLYIHFQIIFFLQISEPKLCMRFSCLSCILLITPNPTGAGTKNISEIDDIFRVSPPPFICERRKRETLYLKYTCRNLDLT
jgi:hypothetical protein